MDFYTLYPSPVGQLLIIGSEDFLRGVWFEGTKYVPADTAPRDDLHLFTQVSSWLDRYFAGNRPDPRELPLAPQGTDFQRLVWKLLLEIPYGEARSYGQLAQQAGRILGKEKMSSQAVGNAVGRNPISIIIPCHRVLGSDGSLTGFGGGLDRKRYLLDLEDIPYK